MRRRVLSRGFVAIGGWSRGVFVQRGLLGDDITLDIGHEFLQRLHIAIGDFGVTLILEERPKGD